MSSSQQCICNSGQCSTSGNCYSCTQTIGFGGLGGGITSVISIVAPVSGVYTITATVTSGSPPSQFGVRVNGSLVTTIQGSGGSANIAVQQGQTLSVGVGWGSFYAGGTVQIQICQPTQSPSPSPSPSPSSSPGPSMTTILAIVLLAALGIGAFLYYELVVKRSET